MTIRITALLLTGALSLAACSGGKETSNTATENTVLLNDESVTDANLTAVDTAGSENAAFDTTGELPLDNGAAGNSR